MASEEILPNANDTLQWTVVKQRWYILFVVTFINITGGFVRAWSALIDVADNCIS